MEEDGKLESSLGRIVRMLKNKQHRKRCTPGVTILTVPLRPGRSQKSQLVPQIHATITLASLPLKTLLSRVCLRHAGRVPQRAVPRTETRWGRLSSFSFVWVLGNHELHSPPALSLCFQDCFVELLFISPTHVKSASWCLSVNPPLLTTHPV